MTASSGYCSFKTLDGSKRRQKETRKIVDYKGEYRVREPPAADNPSSNRPTENFNMLHRFLFSGSLCALLSLVVCMGATTSSAQNVDAILSIDCGSLVSKYVDKDTGLTWEDDTNYVKIGHNAKLPSPIDSYRETKLDNRDALQSFRYFTEQRGKYCYDLALKRSNISVLIRAMFLHGESTELGPLPNIFDVYVNSSLWSTIEYAEEDPEGGVDYRTVPIILEGIFYVAGSMSHFCLVPREGVPFISSLEVRQLDPGGIMYSFQGRNDLFLDSILRWNTGVPLYAPTVRYPDDPYDRLWFNPDSSGIENMNGSPPVETSSHVNNVPAKVMANAWNGSTSSIDEFFALQPTYPTRDLLAFAYIIFYFLDFSSTNNSGGSVMTLSVNNYEMPAFRVTANVSMQSYTNSILKFNQQLGPPFSLDSNSTTFVNAMEVYEEKVFDASATDERNVYLTNFLKTTFNMTGWEGDPCSPVPYGWVTCNNGSFTDSLTVASVNLSNVRNSSGLLDTALSVKDETDYPFLDKLYLTHSDVNDTILQFLIENVTSAKYLSVLDLSHNDITVPPTEEVWQDALLSRISFSHNHLSGEMPSFANYPFAQSLQQMDLSYNSLTALPALWENSTLESRMINLEVIDVSHNNISGDLSLLWKFVLRKNFSRPSQEVILDHNAFRGLLDLSEWQRMMQTFTAMPSSASTTQFLLSLKNNSISDINPSAEDLRPLIDRIRNDSRFNRSGILLHGNPYCKNLKSLPQNFLCRSSISEIVTEPIKRKKDNKVAIIIGVTGGALALFIGCIMSAIVWKLLQQVRVLREFQLELSNRKVQPPFFSYNDLKLATRSFHNDSKLGSGSFGAVYKGVLRDGTQVAVKKLFTSQKNQQVLNDFLNEVVLITGIKHTNLVQLMGCCVKENERILVYEFAEKGNVGDALWGSQTELHGNILSWDERLNICLGIARGLSYLHEDLRPRIIHRDIKAVNVLIDKNLNPKIADFGLAKPFYEDESLARFTYVAGTRGYMAPEYVLDGQLTQKADVYGFGILLLEIVSGRTCIDFTQPEETVSLKQWAEDLQKQQKPHELLQPQLQGKCSPDEVLKVINIAFLCTRTEPKLRPRMSQVVVMLVGMTDDLTFYDSEGMGPFSSSIHDPQNPRFTIGSETFEYDDTDQVEWQNVSEESPLTPSMEKRISFTKR